MRLWELAPTWSITFNGAGQHEMCDEPEYVDAALGRLGGYHSDEL